ncbi:SDR family oxidoreductase [Amycolatopsis sp. NBC_01480]|uniref:SDR family oxidoreductase n=1 Tax=Amycolatopsis sp. NBC_01480 TaxID=2903562 RepID=UPI002E29A470|nr:SDR family oxidoreductase [Amycolatopsis sp. NBC_01480]
MSHPVFDVRGRTALVTGSSRGIGEALARGLAEAGCVIVLNGRDEAKLAQTRQELAESTGATVFAVPFDVTDPDAVAAGIAQALETNLSSAFFVGREVARGMKSRGRVKIVNVCSVQSELARPGITPYTATKGGLKMLTKGMCADLGPSGIQVNGLAPGYFDTELNAALVADEDFSAWIRGRTPAGRWGRIEDLVGALLFLCAPASDFVNGQLLHVDGGITAVL